MADADIPEDRAIVTRAEALKSGIEFYFTGKPCKHGHVAARRTLRRHCAVCVHEYAASEDQRAKARERYRCGGESAKERARSWARANPERHKAAVQAWIARNPRKSVEYVNRRRALKVLNGGRHTAEEVQTRLASQQYRCAGCRTSIRRGFEVDHIVPLSRGGSNDISNIQLLCMKCNRRKGAKDQVIWAQENGRLL